jgi:hypothetical protein
VSFKQIRFPDSFAYSSDSEHVSLEFYNVVFAVAKTVDLFLWYFNFGVFRLLSKIFGEFKYSGGKMGMINYYI